MIKKKKIILILVLFFFIVGSGYLFSILINMTEKYSNVDFSTSMKEINNEELYIFLTETSATEKINLSITNDGEFYYVEYYSVPLDFFSIPISKYKIKKEFLNIVNYRDNTENIYFYTCFGNIAIKDYPEIGYYNDRVKNRCLKIKPE